MLLSHINVVIVLKKWHEKALCTNGKVGQLWKWQNNNKTDDESTHDGTNPKKLTNLRKQQNQTKNMGKRNKSKKNKTNNE